MTKGKKIQKKEEDLKYTLVLLYRVALEKVFFVILTYSMNITVRLTVRACRCSCIFVGPHFTHTKL